MAILKIAKGIYRIRALGFHWDFWRVKKFTSQISTGILKTLAIRILKQFTETLAIFFSLGH